MQIVIPMSGLGERFARAGYTVPKAMIEVDGKPMVAHVVDLFPGETDILLVCNREHLEQPQFRMRALLREYCPGAQVVAIEPHKLGPVHAVRQVVERIDADQPVVVNYCDFTCYWDYEHFKCFVQQTECDGAIPAYRGFHPHSLGSTYYAYLREENGWVQDIQEKQPFTDTPMQEFASSGTYHFANGALLRHYFDEVVRRDLTVNGEYYVSMVYRPMIEDGLSIAHYEIQHFMQWGTPPDLEQYQRWSNAFAALAREASAPPSQRGAVVVPMAGSGKRFSDEGYALPKPAIPVSGRAMAVQAASDLPVADQYVFVVRDDQDRIENTTRELEESYPGTCFVRLDKVTDGQARTALFGIAGVQPDLPVTIGACDNGMLYDRGLLRALLDDDQTDVIVWVMRGHPGAAHQPRMYSWVELAGEHVRRIGVKEPPADPKQAPAVIGTFTFRRASNFVAAAQRMIDRDARVNGEFYIDTCINDAIALGLKCRPFQVDHYFGWGTPDDLRTFEYWQSCFAKWPSHPYSLDLDRHVPAAARSALTARYAETLPDFPGARV